VKLAIMQPYFFPYIGYWQLIAAVDRFVIYDDVNYIKSGWINRNRILINGDPTYMTVPLNQSSRNKKICDLSLLSSLIWRKKLVKMVGNTYRRTPCFSEVFPVIEKIILYEANNLSDYLTHQIQELSAFMGIQAKIIQTSRCYDNSKLVGQDRILDICIQEGATIYINPQGGVDLYDRDSFIRNEIDLKFLMSFSVEYKQFGLGHVPWLSIIDVLMFNTKSQIHAMLNQYKLV